MSEKPEKYLKRPEDFAYDLRRIGADDFALLIPLMNDCFGMDADIDYFRWKYIQNPAGSFIGFIAVDNFTGVVGGYYGVIPQFFELNGVETTVYQSCDTMTHSQHRRRGLFQKLAVRCYQELEAENKLFVIGFGGGQSTPGFLKFGWKRVFDFRYYFKPAILCKLSKGPDSLRQEVKVTTALTALDDGLDVSRPQLRGKAKGIRKAEQIRWRLQNPNHKYLALRLKDDAVSYIIFYVDNDKIVLFDIHVNELESGKKMIAFLCSEVAKKGFKGIISFCQENGTDANTLNQLGFINNPFSFGPLNERVPFILFSSEDRMQEFISPTDWCVTTYDHDSL